MTSWTWNIFIFLPQSLQCRCFELQTFCLGLIVLSLEGTGMHGAIHVYGRDHGRAFLVISCVWRNLSHPTGARAPLDTPGVLAAATGQRDTCRIQSLFKILLPWSWPRSSPSQGSVRSEAIANGDYQSLLSGWMRSKLSSFSEALGHPLWSLIIIFWGTEKFLRL